MQRTVLSGAQAAALKRLSATMRRRRRIRGRTTTRRRVPRKLANFRTGGYLGLEMKFADIETDSDAFAVTWSTMEDATNDSISGVAQGDGESQRDGRIYWIHSIHIRCNVEAASQESQVTPLSNLRGRFMLVWDTQTNGAQLTATDVMDGGGTDDVLAFRNLQHSKRFRVMWDKQWVLARPGQTNEGGVNVFAAPYATTGTFIYNKRFKNPVKVICQATTAVIAAISDNSFHIIGVADSTVARLNMQVRIRFTG